MDLSKNLTEKQLREWFADSVLKLSRQIGFKVSSRGWGYIMEQQGLITKDQFDKVELAINRCRRLGLLPVDFVAEEQSRAFEEIHTPETDSLPTHVSNWLRAAHDCDRHFEPDWWEGEEYYIQMVVEKIDLVTLFQPICRDYHIPIANSKGWSSILQRADYCRRFAEAEQRGLSCVLLYCGDHDPDGLRISDTLRKNLDELKNIEWTDGAVGYDPEDLVIDRFGLEYKFIIQNNFPWIDNLITGRGMDLAHPNHPNHNLPYLQTYLKKIGPRKCEANVMVLNPAAGRELCEKAITKYLGKDARQRFRQKRGDIRVKIDKVLDDVGIREHLVRAIEELGRME